MDKLSTNVISEVVSDNKEVFGGVGINRNIFKKYLADIAVPSDIHIKIIDTGVYCDEYFEVAERLAENHNNKIILISASSAQFMREAIGERKFLDFYSKSNVFFLTTPVSFKEAKIVVDTFIKFHSPELEKI